MFESFPPVALAARILPILFSILLFTIFTLDDIFPSDDPYRCKALLGSGRNGSWIHAPDEDGERKPFTNWQPDGCMLHHYNAEDIKECMGDRHMVFSGDSTTRQIFWGAARLLDRQKANKGRKELERHTNYDLKFNGIRLVHIWNPFYQTGNKSFLTGELERFSDEKHNPSKERKKEERGPGLTMLGAGCWYAGNYYEGESAKRFGRAFDNITSILHFDDLPEFGTAPMDPEEGVGNEVFIAPVAPPFYKLLPASRTRPKALQRGEVEAIDRIIYNNEDEHNLRLLRAFPQLSVGQPGAIVDKKGTGFHVIDTVAEIKANILLNLRCNAKLDRKIGYPFSRTCCTDYGSRSWAHLAIIGITAVYAALCISFELISLVSSVKVNRSQWLDLKVGVFAIALLYCYLADRTHLFSKGSKEFVPKEFGLLVGICSIVGLVSFRRTKFRAPRLPGAENAPAKTEAEDAGILSRDQTEEWKGWMQAAILVYHWTGASKNLPIYIFIRLLVAAYLFQTGYGHTIYFLAKKDFSFRRIANVLLRLNLLSCALPYIMGTDYMFYYFAPLVSFWFLIVYATLAICSGFNDSIKILVGKIAGSFVFVTVILNITPVLKWIFAILDVVFRIKWDLNEWTFRVTLDGAIVFVGMLAGVVHQRIERDSSWYTSYKTAIIPSALAIVGFAFCCSYFEEKAMYVLLHPVISIVPVVAFIALRNATTPVRNFYSTASAWLGRCSLETFILQFHVFLAADTQGVLLLDAFKGDGSLLGDRWRNLAVIVPIFLWISHLVAEASGEMVKLIMSQPEAKPPVVVVETAVEDEEEDDENQLKIIEPVWANLNSFHLDRAKQFLDSFSTAPQLRIGAILGVMWLLNWLY
ncbi:hypothetical protein NW762_013025 [Fusarium torreyae]|uniref:Cas1p 10 TM acyl transferase domain-containing protein n=1 Tax=Fusarium torreyae TaxID=1237075 RepID=A0A9W8RQ30_9HYPO|nr:hypothetical protein NW762_013025 [Fusarium torreyae]